MREQPSIPHPFRFLCVTISKSPLLQETSITCELAGYTLEMVSFDDRNSDIFAPELFSAHLNLSPKRVSHRHYFAEAQSQYLGVCAAHNDCDWFREKQTRWSVFSSIPECVCVESDLSPALSAVERGLSTQDYLPTQAS